MEKVDKELIEIKMTFSNGEEKLVKQGMVVDFEAVEDDKDLVETIYHFLNMSGADLRMAVMSMVELGAKLGMFDDEEVE